MKFAKKFLAVFLSLVFSVSIIGVEVSANSGVGSENLLLNPSFEDGLNYWTAKKANTSWDIAEDLEVRQHSTDYPLVGGYGISPTALLIPEGYSELFGSNYASSPNTNRPRLLLTQKVTGLRPKNTYEFSGWGFISISSSIGTSYSNAGEIICSFYSTGTNPDVDQPVSTETATMKLNSRVWTNFRATFLLPEGVDTVVVGIKNDTSTGTTYLRSFDNFSLVRKDNLITNPGFETTEGGHASNAKAQGWYKTNNDATYSFATESHNGNIAYQSDGWGRIEQAVPALENTKYRLSYWYKSADNNKEWQSYGYARFLTNKPTTSDMLPAASTSTISGIEFRSVSLLSSDGWQKCITYFTTPPATKGISIVLNSFASSTELIAEKGGKCIFDDVELVLIDKEDEFLGFTTESANYEPVINTTATGTYACANEHDPVLLSKTICTTIKFVDAISGGDTVYAVAVTASNTALLFGVFSEKNEAKVLERMEVTTNDITLNKGLISTGVTVPNIGGQYTLKAMMWKSVEGLVPILKVELPISVNK